MHDREHEHAIRLDRVDDGVRELLEHDPADAGLELRPSLGGLPDDAHRRAHGGDEPLGSGRVLLRIPLPRVLGLGFGLPVEDDLALHSRVTAIGGAARPLPTRPWAAHPTRCPRGDAWPPQPRPPRSPPESLLRWSPRAR